MIVNNIQTTDPLYYNAAAPVTTASTTLTTGIAALTSITGANYYMSPWPYMPEVFTIALQTVSFDSSNPVYGSMNFIPVPGFYKYPFTGQNCYYAEVYNTFLD